MTAAVIYAVQHVNHLCLGYWTLRTVSVLRLLAKSYLDSQHPKTNQSVSFKQAHVPRNASWQWHRCCAFVFGLYLGFVELRVAGVWTATNVACVVARMRKDCVLIQTSHPQF